MTWVHISGLQTPDVPSSVAESSPLAEVVTQFPSSLEEHMESPTPALVPRRSLPPLEDKSPIDSLHFSGEI